MQLGVNHTVVSPLTQLGGPDMANKSLCCFFHHSVDSGMVEGAAVPYTRVIGSSSLPVEQPLLPASCRFLFVKKSSATMILFKNQNPQSALFRNHDWINKRRFFACLCGIPDPASDNMLPVP